jgi:hypothetical protein
VPWSLGIEPVTYGLGSSSGVPVWSALLRRVQARSRIRRTKWSLFLSGSAQSVATGVATRPVRSLARTTVHASRARSANCVRRPFESRTVRCHCTIAASRLGYQVRSRCHRAARCRCGGESVRPSRRRGWRDWPLRACGRRGGGVWSPLWPSSRSSGGASADSHSASSAACVRGCPSRAPNQSPAM